MKIILYVGGMPFDADTIASGKSLGGSESAGFYLAKELAKKHHVLCFTNMQKEPHSSEGVLFLPIGAVNEKFPLGENFENFARKVPHDVLIGQRHPRFFEKRFNSKCNLWWCHDLALERNKNHMASQLWNLDRILTVSNFHKNQVHDNYGIPQEYIGVLRNAVDQEAIPKIVNVREKFNSKTMVYSHRPERGLENLVCEGGIMEQLYKLDPEIRLIVTGYDNTTKEMVNYYQHLWGRCKELPNVDLYPPSSKETLYTVMSGAFLHIYPTEFEETSCITVMEECCNGTPLVATRAGALEETLADAGVTWVRDAKDYKSVANTIHDLSKNFNKWNKLHKRCLEASKTFNWVDSVRWLEEEIGRVFLKKTDNPTRVLKHFIKNSDIVTATKYMEKYGDVPEISEYIEKHFAYAFRGEFDDFYSDVADYNKNIGNHHRLGDYDFHLNTLRVQPVAQEISQLPKGSKVLDYGCCVGQQTTAYAKAFPDLEFVGIDISSDQIEIATTFAKENELKNVRFAQGNSPEDLEDSDFDMVISSEVMEHVFDYETFLTGLINKCKLGGRLVICTPVGPYELETKDAQTKKEHIHHFEEQDLHEIFKSQKNYVLNYVYNYDSPFGDPLGNFITAWTKTETPLGKINYDRKFLVQSPDETLSVCMIAKKDGHTLGKTLDTIKNVASEIIIGFDESTEGYAEEIANTHGARIYEQPSPIEIGFDEARNKTIDKATSDWILWIDDDETLIWPEHLPKYLRHSPIEAFAVPQHHFSAQPSGKLKTDFPARIFRNHMGVKFFGIVHEHPEKALNKGFDCVMMFNENDIAICHNGYSSEMTRRQRFMRNWPLMVADRKKYPDRELAQFLWIRDLSHMNRFQFEKIGQITPDMRERSEEAIRIWRELTKDGKLKLSLDSLPYMSECVDLLTQGAGLQYSIDVKLQAGIVGDNPEPDPIIGMFLNKEDIELFNGLIMNQKFNRFERKYL